MSITIKVKEESSDEAIQFWNGEYLILEIPVAEEFQFADTNYVCII